jgi:coproporphyrinogen III oxidase
MRTMLMVHSSLLSAVIVQAWTVSPSSPSVRGNKSLPFLPAPHVAALCGTASSSSADTSATVDASLSSLKNDGGVQIFDDFVDFLKQKQAEIIQQLEDMESKSSGAKFSRDCWGVFDDETTSANDVNKSMMTTSGGITRVLQGGDIIEKGACSLTLIQQGVLTADRAATLRSRQADSSDGMPMPIQAGDLYAAAALSMVLHSKSPLVPTFRSDVRVFVVYPQKVNNNNNNNKDGGDNNMDESSFMAWFGGGADLTPYYLVPEDITFFHEMYRDLCREHWKAENDDAQFSYQQMKKACDGYFYLPARSEHRGTGGIFFDDMVMTNDSLAFVKGVANAWMPSWFPIVEKRQGLAYTDEQRHWQLLRRGRYLEFNLLYDRGVKFGLANANPRVEGVMVSAPPLIAFEYNHKVIPGSEEEKLMTVLRTPRDWV